MASSEWKQGIFHLLKVQNPPITLGLAGKSLIWISSHPASHIFNLTFYHSLARPCPLEVAGLIRRPANSEFGLESYFNSLGFGCMHARGASSQSQLAKAYRRSARSIQHRSANSFGGSLISSYLGTITEKVGRTQPNKSADRTKLGAIRIGFHLRLVIIFEREYKTKHKQKSLLKIHKVQWILIKFVLDLG